MASQDQSPWSPYGEFPLYPAAADKSPIRLLRLRPEQHEAPIRDELLCGDLDDGPKFEALSYTWGSTADQKTITLSGRPWKVTQNLFSALQHLRLPDRDRILWVDALCINQADNNEKSLQVDQMRRVYAGNSSTERVLVWLGDDPEGKAKMALEFLLGVERQDKEAALIRTRVGALAPGRSTEELIQIFGRLSEKLAELAKVNPDMSREDAMATLDDPIDRTLYENYDSINIPNPSLQLKHDEEWDACAELFSSPWWSRTWILQEAIHDREVLVNIGFLDPIPIEPFCYLSKRYRYFVQVRQANGRDTPHKPSSPESRASSWLTTGGTTEEVDQSILTMRQYATAPNPAGATSLYPPRLSQLLLSFRHQQATDPRDKVFAFLGMATPEYRDQLRSDYSLSKRTVYTRTQRLMLVRVLVPLLWVESRDREILPSVERSDRETLPSWVPDHATRQTFLTRAMNTQWTNFAANRGFPAREPGKEEPHRHQPVDAEVLALRGICVGTVTDVRDVRMTADPHLSGDDSVRLMAYVGAGAGGCEHRLGSDASFGNTSWGPCRAAAGDIIIIAATSTIPLVLRNIIGAEGYVFVGACWLIRSELRRFSHAEDSENPWDVKSDPGFSKVMFGSACVGATEDQVEILHIY